MGYIAHLAEMQAGRKKYRGGEGGLGANVPGLNCLRECPETTGDVGKVFGELCRWGEWPGGNFPHREMFTEFQPYVWGKLSQSEMSRWNVQG